MSPTFERNAFVILRELNSLAEEWWSMSDSDQMWSRKSDDWERRFDECYARYITAGGEPFL